MKPVNKAADRANFARENRRYLGLLNIAARDYAGARCCLKNCIFSGLQLGSQAIEKTMKAHIALTDNQINTTRLSHNLIKLNSKLKEIATGASISNEVDLNRWREFYNARYSFDRQGNEISHPSASNVAELSLLDDIMTHLVKNSPEFPGKFRCGIYALVRRDFHNPEYRFGDGFWIINDNEAMITHLSEIDQEISEDI